MKYSLGQLVLAFLIEFVIKFYTTEIIINKNIESQQIIILITVRCFCKSIDSLISYLFEKFILKKRLNISQRITNYVNNLYLDSSYSWKLKNPNASQKELEKYILLL